MEIKVLPKTYKEKLFYILETSKTKQKNDLAKMLEVDYRQVHRWMSEGSEPSKPYRREIDHLFRQHVDITPLVLNTVRDMKDPIQILKNDSRVREDFYVKMIYHSNAIEGSPMTEKDTRAVIHGQVVQGVDKNMAAHMEVVNHKNAISHLLQEIRPGFQITEEYILKLNGLVISGFMDKLPGQYRTGFVNLTNTDVITPNAQEVPKRMKELVKTINHYGDNPIAKIARDHVAFEVIHPFFDGNGRTGRLIMMTQFLSQGLPPAVVRIQDRHAYYMGLEKCSLGETNYLTHVVAEAVLVGHEILNAL